MKLKITILIFSMIYCGYLLILLVANHYGSSVLNPLDSEFYYKNGNLVKAIEAEPVKAEYHMYYGIELLNTLPNDKVSAQNQLRLARFEFTRAIKLSFYNKSYQKICKSYVAWIDRQF